MPADKKILDLLNQLVTLDQGAVAAYGAAIEQIDDDRIAKALRGFQKDHERHVRDLTKEVRRLGAEVEEIPQVVKRMPRKPDDIRKITDPMELLQGMYETEELTNEMYEKALQVVRGEEQLRKIVERNREDERRHITWIEQHLQQPVGGGELDLNAASVEQLERVGQLDGERARFLVQHREKQGPFGSWDDVKRVRSFEAGMVERLQQAGFTVGGRKQRGERAAARTAPAAGRAKRASGAPPRGGGKGKAGTHDLNRASLEDLEAVHMIGDERARRLLAYRERHGRITNWDEIKDLEGFDEGLIERLKQAGFRF